MGSCLLDVRTGRLVLFGPDWPESEACLAFDAASGDVWILTSLARRMVTTLVNDGPLNERELRARVAVGGFGEVTDAVWCTTLSEVIVSRLLQPFGSRPDSVNDP